MNELNYVVRFYSSNGYLYSIHCSVAILSEVIEDAKATDSNIDHVKVVAYSANESEV